MSWRHRLCLERQHIWARKLLSYPRFFYAFTEFFETCKLVTSISYKVLLSLRHATNFLNQATAPNNLWKLDKWCIILSDGEVEAAMSVSVFCHTNSKLNVAIVIIIRHLAIIWRQFFFVQSSWNGLISLSFVSLADLQSSMPWRMNSGPWSKTWISFVPRSCHHGSYRSARETIDLVRLPGECYRFGEL